MAYGGERGVATYPVGMARSPLTLAALATSAVAELEVAGAARFGSGEGDYDSAILATPSGEYRLIRVPRSARAERDQSADLVALRALSQGVRSRLPFAVPTYLGQAPAQPTRGVVYDVVPGRKTTLAAIDQPLAASMGEAIAAIHSLPTSFVADAGLPGLAPIECLRAAVSVMDRAAATGLVPAALLARWTAATEDSKLWQFQPAVIHGDLSASSFLVDPEGVTGVLGWQELKIGDPARDLAWVIGSRTEGVPDAAFDAYHQARGSHDRQLKQRATLYAELELAKWLLHGTETRSTEIVDDAVELLSGLVDSVRDDIMNPLSAQTMPTPTVDEVQEYLARAERAV